MALTRPSDWAVLQAVMSFFSITVTLKPSCAAIQAVVRPISPPPLTIMSDLFFFIAPMSKSLLPSVRCVKCYSWIGSFLAV